MPITNRDRYPNVEFLPDSEIKPVGDVGGTTLVKVGTEEGTDVMVVARSYSQDPTTEDLFAVPLYELLNHSPDPVTIL
jgi:hypothetical protein